MNESTPRTATDGETLGELAQLVKHMAQSLVDESEQVQVREVLGENTTVVELTVAKSDLGKIIGKEGKTARALRAILHAASKKYNRRTVLEIIE